MNTEINNYQGLDKIFFNGYGGVLTIHSSDNAPISFIKEVSPHTRFEHYGAPDRMINVITDFIVGHNSIADINTINIGNSTRITPTVFTIDTGAAGDINLLNGSSTIKFQQENSVFKLQNSYGGAHIVTLNRDFAPPLDNYGIVELNASGIENILTIKAGNEGAKLGQADKNLKELRVIGDTSIMIEPEVFAKIINLNSKLNSATNYITFNKTINGNIIFDNDTTLNAQEGITGDLDFAGKAGKVTDVTRYCYQVLKIFNSWRAI